MNDTKPKSTWGGSRGGGRPRELNSANKRTIVMEDDTFADLKLIGGGNVSHGLRVIYEYYRTKHK